MSTFRIERPGTGVVWSRVEDGFHVGSRAGDFVGYIDRQPDGRYLAFDLRSRPVGHFVELTDAMRALATPVLSAAPHETRSPGSDEQPPPIELREMR